MGEYRKASYFWEIKAKYAQDQNKAVPTGVGINPETASVQEEGEADQRKRSSLEDKGNTKGAEHIDIQEYMELFAGRKTLTRRK